MSTPLSLRLTSLDAFRGFTIAAMVLVNNPGDWNHLYAPLAHAKWHGWTFTDWIFPFFLFICGVSMNFSIGQRAQQGADKSTLLMQLLKRALIIFLIGLSLNLIPSFNLATLRIPGVLQRIALCTMLAAPIVLYCSWRAQCWWIVGLLTLTSVLMLGVAVPDQYGFWHVGLLEPGADIGSAIDRIFLSGHMWSQSKTWDPEGLFSTLPALCTQLFGVLTGRWLLTRTPPIEKTVWMLLAGLLFLWLGAMADASFMPINKSLWTPSYAVFMSGWALILFAVFYWFLDAVDLPSLRAKAKTLAKPCIMYGMNALFIFAFSGLVAKLLGFVKIPAQDGTLISLKSWLYAPLQAMPLSATGSSLLFALLFNGCMLIVAWVMWRKQWFVKV